VQLARADLEVEALEDFLVVDVDVEIFDGKA